MEKFPGFVQKKILSWIEGGIKTVLLDIALFADSLYPIFVVICIIGVYLSMAGDKKRGGRLSSTSIIIYLIVKVMASAYGK